VAQLGSHMGIRNRANGHLVQHLSVLFHFVCFEFVHRELTLIDSDKVNEFAVLFNIDVGLLNASLQIENVFFLAFFRLKK